MKVVLTKPKSRTSIVPACGLLFAAVLAIACAGCVQRRMTIRSNPPGAFVYVDNYPIGTTPVSTDFVYYGKRQFRLVRDGYETLTVDQKVSAPWYQWFGIDFISENLIPYNIRDERTLDFQMAPQMIPPAPQLTARAEELRASSQAQRYVPIAPPPGVMTGPVTVPPPPAVMPGGAPPVGLQPGGPGTLVPPPTTGQPAYVKPPPTGAPATQVPAPGAQPIPQQIPGAQPEYRIPPP